MKIIIIEDEALTAEDLAEVIFRVEPDAEIVATLGSVKEAASFFSKPVEADLIFSDIQLGDGLSFEIFKDIPKTIPVIFCTSYDEYALNAFKTNGIDYVLKPFSSATIKNSLLKFKELKKVFSTTSHNFDQLLDNLTMRVQGGSILVHYKGQIIPIADKDIVLACIRNDVTMIKTFDGKSYFLSKTLDEIEVKLGGYFFRANRQYLVNRRAVKSIENYGNRKMAILLSTPHDEVITVSKEKYSQLIKWLEVIY